HRCAFLRLLAWIPVTSAVKALDSLSIGRRPTHGNDGDFFNYLIVPLYLALLVDAYAPARARRGAGMAGFKF
ncbi:DUF1658 domain-containing protein, partial [Coxiella burnetii]